jgi:hypothetical protein
MITTATIRADGVYFLALGSHDSVFKTTLSFAALRKHFTPEVNAAIAENP